MALLYIIVCWLILEPVHVIVGVRSLVAGRGVAFEDYRTTLLVAPEEACGNVVRFTEPCDGWRNPLSRSVVRHRSRDSAPAAEAALKLDSVSGLAHAVLGVVHTDYDWDWPAAARQLKTAVALAPNNPTVLVFAGEERLAVGQWAEAVHFLDAASTADPLVSTLRARVPSGAHASAPRPAGAGIRGEQDARTSSTRGLLESEPQGSAAAAVRSQLED